MDTPLSLYDAKFKELVDALPTDLETNEATTAMKNFKTFSESRPPQPELESLPAVPETRWGRLKLGAARALDNETTRTLIKAGGAFAGVAVVAYSTIHKDHVLERQAMNQANQQIR